jgi:hypothetical protein
MATQINEPITAGVVFEPGRIRPAWFIWHHRRYAIQEVTQRWHTKEGQAAILHLGVTDGATAFERAFNQQTLVWSLASTEADGCE